MDNAPESVKEKSEYPDFFEAHIVEDVVILTIAVALLYAALSHT